MGSGTGVEPMTKVAKKSHEIARMFVDGAESRGLKRAAWGYTTTYLSEKQGEWLRSVVEREKGHYRSPWGDSRIMTTTWQGRPEDPRPGSGDIAFTLTRMRGRWCLEYLPADPLDVAKAEAAYDAEQRAWLGDTEWESRKGYRGT
jgi:hypothetical protein